MEQNVRDPYDFCRPYLLEDEYILWKGRPERGNIFRQGDWMVVIFAVMWLGFSLFWEFSALKSVMSGGGSLFLALWGLPFVAIGLYLLFGGVSCRLPICGIRRFMSSQIRRSL